MLFPFQNVPLQAKLIILTISLLMLNSVLVGCSIGNSKSDVQQVELTPSEETIESYLKGLISWPISGDEVITTFEVLGQDQDMIYLWAVQWEYYKRSTTLDTGKGWSSPMILIVKPSKNGELSIVSHKVPREGKYYEEDIKKMFPEQLHKEIFTYASTPITALLFDLEYGAHNFTNQEEDFHKSKGLQQSKMDQLQELDKKGKLRFGEYHRQAKLIAGELPSDVKRVSLLQVKQIIAKNDFESTLAEIEEIVLYPDFEGGSGVTIKEYWLDDKGNKRIRVIVEQKEIYYDVMQDEFNILRSERLN